MSRKKESERKFEVDKHWDKFRDLHQANSRYNGFKEAMQNTSFIKWFADLDTSVDPEENAAYYFSTSFSRLRHYRQTFLQETEVKKIIQHENMDKMLSILSPEDVYHLLYDIKFSMRESIRIQDLLEFPKIAKFALSEMEKDPDPSWEKRLQNLDIITRLHPSSNVDPKMLRENLMLVHGGKDFQTRGQRKRYERTLMKALKKDGLYYRAINSLADAGFRADYKSEHQKWMQDVKDLEIDKREDRRSPIAHLKPTMGVEVEHRQMHYSYKHSAALMQLVGIDAGKGGRGGAHSYDEFSPGPFIDYRTANLVLQRLIDSEHIDLDVEKNLSMHIDVGVRYFDGATHYLRLLQGTGLMYSPNMVDTSHLVSRTDIYVSKIAQKGLGEDEHSHGPFLDFKDFHLPIPEQIEESFRYAYSLASCLNAYQKGLLEIFKDYDDDDCDDDDKYISKRLEYRDLNLSAFIGLKTLTHEEKLLATIYQQLIIEMQQVYKDQEIESCLFLMPSMFHISSFSQKIIDIYPDTWSRYDIDPAEVETKAFEIGGKKYSNIVDYSQKKCIQISEQVERVFELGQKRFINLLNKTDHDDIDNLKYLFSEFPSGIDLDITTFEEMRERALELKREHDVQ